MKTTTVRPVYFDCDTGIDDSMALGYLVSSPEISLVGVGTVSGNTSAEQAAENTLRLLALADRPDVPVAIGEHHFRTTTFTGGPTHIHGANGIGNVALPESSASPIDRKAAELLVELSHEHAGELEIITVGPTTNIAAALDLDPTLPSRVRQITSMGGAALVSGNASPVGEANIWNDPEAASRVLAAHWPATLVPLDVTLANNLEEEHRDALLTSQRPLAQAIGQMLDLYFDFYVPEFGRRCSALHDPLAAAIAVGGIRPTVAPAVDVTVDDTHGPGRGQTICDLRGQRLGAVDQPGRNVRVVLDTDQPLADHLVERLVPVSSNIE
ncbi:nucleoside hydrolase [Georgenia sp. EYE_87]|uniref:nucleoside hydrolase n=1 Tax=Georgenia sp. EYE_87 TaxID=2853448 RepID=UPI0020031FBE|nr:nucleoside hydrolase [Georgenia sp. EYE_87]